MLKAIHRGVYHDLIEKWDPELFKELYPNYLAKVYRFAI